MGRAEPCQPGCGVQANHGALIAKIGSNPPFFVGEDFDFMVNTAWSGRVQ